MAQTYSESSSAYNESYNIETDYFPVTHTADNLWILTEDDNYMVTEK